MTRVINVTEGRITRLKRSNVSLDLKVGEFIFWRKRNLRMNKLLLGDIVVIFDARRVETFPDQI